MKNEFSIEFLINMARIHAPAAAALAALQMKNNENGGDNEK